MFFVRFFLLLLATIFFSAVGSGNNGAAAVCAVLVLPAAAALYMLPTYEAYKLDAPNLMSVATVNFFLGWSLIGWVVALAWAFKKPEHVVAVLPSQAIDKESSQNASETKQCPYCAETVLAAAIKCKHCGSALVS